MKYLKKITTVISLTLALILMSGIAAGAAVTEDEGGPGYTDGAAVSAEDSSGTKALPALHVSGTGLVDIDGDPVQLKGISTHGIAWYPEYINEDCFADLHSWGVNVIRLAMYTADYNGYCTGGDQTALKDLIRKGVDCATKEGMYVIIDWHILNDGNPKTYETQAKEFFDEMSGEFAGHTNVLYEICNEPNGTNWSDIKSYAEDIIPVIRTNDPDAVIIVGTPTWSQDVDIAAADPITGYDNIMYSLHFYAATHGEYLRDKMRSASSAGLPIFVTEYGICDASGNGGIDIGSADEWVRQMDDLGISYIAWNLSNKAETSAIIKDSVSRISGFTRDDLSSSGQWFYDTITGAR